jgi:3-dehydroquinate synthase
LISQDDVDRMGALFVRAGLPIVPPELGEAAYMDSMGIDKKVEGGKIRFVLFKRLGEAFVTGDYDAQALSATLTGAQ